jgi:endoglucanase
MVRRVPPAAIAIVSIALATVPALFFGSTPQPVDARVETIEVWWPTEGAVVSGTETFKAVLSGSNLNRYEMHWQVDGGAINEMANSYEDRPYKQASVDLSQWPAERSYEVSFVATTKNGKELGQRTVTIVVSQPEATATPTTTTVPSTTTTTTAPSTTTTSTSTTTTVPSTTTTTVPSTTTATRSAPSVLTGATLYVDPWSPAKAHANDMRGSHPYEASLLDKIANQPAARWFGDWNGDIFTAVDEATDTITAAGALPVYVAYNIPLRDCSGYSAGGSQSADDYRSWIGSFAMGIGSRSAAVILEPDALALLDCLSVESRAERVSLLSDAIQTLGAGGSTAVYLDAGHARWHSVEEIARRLEAAGVAGARGFALNVSNFVGTEETVAYGQEVSALLGGTPFVVDTSRNGLGPAPDGEWCNPPDRALGLPPTTHTGKSAVDAYLWVKIPGESDGTCNGGPVAGNFWTEYALGLAERADW